MPHCTKSSLGPVQKIYKTCSMLATADLLQGSTSFGTVLVKEPVLSSRHPTCDEEAVPQSYFVCVCVVNQQCESSCFLTVKIIA